MSFDSRWKRRLRAERMPSPRTCASDLVLALEGKYTCGEREGAGSSRACATSGSRHVLESRAARLSAPWSPKGKSCEPGSSRSPQGVFSFKARERGSDALFAGEGDPFRTNRRFHLLSKDMPAKRLSTAFDSVTLYGFDPDLRPDIYGKVGNSGVSIATLEDMKVLYSGFDLCDPATSVSMTINGPAPTILAMFLNCAIDQQTTSSAQKTVASRRPPSAGDQGGNTFNCSRHGAGGHFEGRPGPEHLHLLDEFSLKVMGDVQEYSSTTTCGISTPHRSPDTISQRPARIRSRQLALPSRTVSRSSRPTSHAE